MHVQLVHTASISSEPLAMGTITDLDSEALLAAMHVDTAGEWGMCIDENMRRHCRLLCCRLLADRVRRDALQSVCN